MHQKNGLSVGSNNLLKRPQCNSVPTFFEHARGCTLEKSKRGTEMTITLFGSLMETLVTHREQWLVEKDVYVFGSYGSTLRLS